MPTYLPGLIIIGLIVLLNVWQWRRRAKMTQAERDGENKQIKEIADEGW